MVKRPTSEQKHRWDYYDCDGGSLKIGANGFAATFPNCMGDGEYTCHILEGYDGFSSPGVALEGDWVFEGAVEGDEIIVYSYDCGDKPLFKLKGHYGVYALKQSGDMCLMKWK